MLRQQAPASPARYFPGSTVKASICSGEFEILYAMCPAHFPFFLSAPFPFSASSASIGRKSDLGKVLGFILR